MTTADGVTTVTATRLQFVGALRDLYPLAELDELGDMADALMAHLPGVPHKHSHPVNDGEGTWLDPGPCVCGMTQAETLAEATP